MERIRASERTREKLKAPTAGRAEVTDERSELVRLAARLVIEEALEGEAKDALGRDCHARGAAPGAGCRNGYRRGQLKTAEGAVEYGAPQVVDRAEPPELAEGPLAHPGGRAGSDGGVTQELETLAVEMYARGLRTRDIEWAVDIKPQTAAARFTRRVRRNGLARAGISY